LNATAIPGFQNTQVWQLKKKVSGSRKLPKTPGFGFGKTRVGNTSIWPITQNLGLMQKSKIGYTRLV